MSMSNVLFTIYSLYFNKYESLYFNKYESFYFNIKWVFIHILITAQALESSRVGARFEPTRSPGSVISNNSIHLLQFFIFIKQAENNSMNSKSIEITLRSVTNYYGNNYYLEDNLFRK